MIGRAWRSGRRMRLFCGVCAALRLSQAFGFGLAKRVRGERECLSLFFHNGSASWLTYEIAAAAAAAAAAVPNTMSPSSSFLQLYSYSGGAVMKSNENSLNALFSFSIIHMTDDFIDLFSPPLPRLPFFSLFRRCANADETHWPVTAKAPSSQTRLGRVYNHVFSSKNDENLLCFWALSSVSEGSDNEGHGSHQIRPNRCFIDREREGG